MPVAAGIENLSTTAASNDPQGSEQRNLSDDYLRALSAFLRQTVTAGSDIASASTITPPSTGSSFNVTGTTTITAIGSTNSWDGREITLRFTGAVALAHSASLNLIGSTSIVVVAGSIAKFRQRSSGVWDMTSYVSPSIVYTHDGTNGAIQSKTGGLIVGTIASGAIAFTVNNSTTWQLDTSSRLLNTGDTQPSCTLLSSAARTTTGTFGTYSTTNHNFGTIANASTGVITVPVAGRYRVTYEMRIVANANGDNTVTDLYKNGSSATGTSFTHQLPFGASAHSFTRTFLLDLAASDLLRVELVSLTTAGGTYSAVCSQFSVELVG